MSDDAPNLFDQQAVQGDLFANLPPPVPATPQVDLAKIRRTLHKWLEEARATQEGLPWPYETMRRNRIVFPQMAHWLPVEERDRLRAEFGAELERLGITPHILPSPPY